MHDVEGLKPGDEVFVTSGSSWGVGSISKVERLTPKGFIVVDGVKYDKRGYERGGDAWHSKSICRVEDHHREEIARHKAINEARRLHDAIKITTHISLARAQRYVEGLRAIVAADRAESPPPRSDDGARGVAATTSTDSRAEKP